MIDLNKEREILDREVTFFHYRRARRRIAKCLRHARRLKEDFFVHYFLAQASMLDESFMKALEHLARAIALQPDDGCAHNDKALCFAELGKYQEALACFNEGIHRQKTTRRLSELRRCAFSAQYPVLYHNKGWLLNLEGRHREALLCFKKALELDENRPETFFSLADSCEALGDSASARYYFERALPLLFGRCAYMYRETQKRIAKLTRNR